MVTRGSGNGEEEESGDAGTDEVLVSASAIFFFLFFDGEQLFVLCVSGGIWPRELIRGGRFRG